MSGNPLPYLNQKDISIKSRCELDWTMQVVVHSWWVVQHHEPWTRDHWPVKFNKLAGGGPLTHITFLRWLYQCWLCVSDYQPRSAISCCQWPSNSVNIYITLGYSAAYRYSSTNDMLTCYLPRLEVHSTGNDHTCPFFSVRISADLGDPTFQLIHANCTSHTISSHMNHSYFNISVSKEAISTEYSFFFLVSSAVFSFYIVMRKWWRHHQDCISRIITNNWNLTIEIVAKPTEALAGRCICLLYSGHWQTLCWSLRSAGSGSSKLKLSAL